MTQSSPSRKQVTVFGIGSAAVDFRIRTADLGKDYTEKLLAQKTQALGGGAASNCLVQIARLGGKATWLGKLGTDWIGDRIVDELTAEGVDCTLASRDADLCSPLNVAVYAGEQRRRVGGFLLPNSLAEITRLDWQPWLDRIGPDDWLFAEVGEVPFTAILEFSRAAKDRGTKIAVDVDLDPIAQCCVAPAEIDKLFVLADLLIPNAGALQSFCPNMTPQDMTAHLAETFKTTVVTTVGGMGAYYCGPEQSPRHQPTVEVEVVDTVGAGDAFHGGLLFALAKGETLATAVELASRCGAEACRFAGARTGMMKLSRGNQI